MININCYGGGRTGVWFSFVRSLATQSIGDVRAFLGASLARSRARATLSHSSKLVVSVTRPAADGCPPFYWSPPNFIVARNKVAPSNCLYLSVSFGCNLNDSSPIHVASALSFAFALLLSHLRNALTRCCRYGLHPENHRNFKLISTVSARNLWSTYLAN